MDMWSATFQGASSVKLHSDMTINGKQYRKGDRISPFTVYPFFMFHMLIFGASGFFMAYSDEGPPLAFLYLHGGFAILVYIAFYVTMFGRDEVKWMFINAGLGLFGIYVEVDWLLSLFGTASSDYPLHVHLIPFLYYILYTFLLRQAVIDFTSSREDPSRKRFVEHCYITVSLLVYTAILLLA